MRALDVLPLDIATAASTCLAFAAAARAEVTWSIDLQEHEAPALSVHLAALAAGAAPPQAWRLRGAQLEAVQRVTAIHGELAVRSTLPFYGRRGIRQAAQESSDDDADDDADESSELVLHRHLRLYSLEDFVFFIDAVHAPRVPGDARALSSPSQWTRLLACAVTMSGDSVFGAAADVLPGIIDAAAAEMMPDDDTDEDADHVPPSFDPRGEHYS